MDWICCTRCLQALRMLFNIHTRIFHAAFHTRLRHLASWAVFATVGQSQSPTTLRAFICQRKKSFRSRIESPRFLWALPWGQVLSLCTKQTFNHIGRVIDKLYFEKVPWVVFLYINFFSSGWSEVGLVNSTYSCVGIRPILPGRARLSIVFQTYGVLAFY